MIEGFTGGKSFSLTSDHIWTAEEFMTFPSISKNHLYEELFEIHVNNTGCLTANVLDSVS